MEKLIDAHGNDTQIACDRRFSSDKTRTFARYSLDQQDTNAAGVFLSPFGQTEKSFHN